MLLLLVDTILLALLFLGVVMCARKIIRLGREDKINAALAEQKLAAELAKRVQQINPQEIKNNQAKVTKTLSKLNSKE